MVQAALALALPGLVSCGPSGPRGSTTPTNLAAKVDAVFAAYDKNTSPGCALGVMKDGRIIYERGYGMANLEVGVPIGPTTIFDIGSTSKQFTAASIVLLSQEGKLSLDDDIRKYIPEIPAYRRPITLRLMLHHMSGLRDYLELWDLAGVHTEDLTTDDDAVAIIARQRDTNFPPGDEYLYCNSGFFLMSVIVKRVTGKTLREFAQERIFGPLGMRRTRFHDDHTMIEPGRATGYEPRDGEGFKIDMSDFEQTGDGSVFTNVEDLQKWDENFFSPKVGGPGLLDALQTRGVLTSGETIDYALGLVIDSYKGLRRVSHGGSWAGYRAELARFPDRHFSVACLCNLGTAEPSDLAMKVADIYLADAEAAPAAAPTSESGEGSAPGVALSQLELAEKAGLYRNPLTEEVVKVAVASGGLTITRDNETRALVPLAKDRFRVAGGREDEVTFEAAAAGRTRRVSHTVHGGKPITYEAITPASPAPAQLAAYAGRYDSEELEVTYDLAVENGRLVLRSPRRPKLTLGPTVPDVFEAGGVILKFARDAGRSVTGIALGAGRIRNVRFVRRTR